MNHITMARNSSDATVEGRTESTERAIRPIFKPQDVL